MLPSVIGRDVSPRIPLVSTPFVVEYQRSSNLTGSRRSPTMAEGPELIIRDNPERHRFEANLGGGDMAIAEYTLQAHTITFTHTEVPQKHEGKGIGSALIRHALADARARGLKVIPVCPFFAAYMKKHAEEQDLLEDSWRSRIGLAPLR
jgi:predicted GNAT family acetyltransferase